MSSASAMLFDLDDLPVVEIAKQSHSSRGDVPSLLKWTGSKRSQAARITVLAPSFELPWCTTRDLGQSLPSTPRSEVPHAECHAHPAEVRPDGLPCPELAGVRDGSPRSRESDRLARTHRWQARQLELAEADNASTRTTPSSRRSPWAWCLVWRPGRLRASCARC